MKTAFCRILLSIALMGSAHAQFTLSDGLVAHYQMDGNTLDSSGNGNNLTLSGPFQYVNNHYGNSNGALQFTGTPEDYPYFQAQGTLGTNLGGSSISISLWVSQQIIPQPAGWTFRIGQASANGKAIDIALNYPNDLRWAFFGNDLDVNVTPHPSLDTWYNIVATYDSGTNERSIYYNGEAVASDTASYGFSGDNFVGIGWNGLTLSDFRVYNRVLSPAEAAQLAIPEPGEYSVLFGLVGLGLVIHFQLLKKLKTANHVINS